MKKIIDLIRRLSIKQRLIAFALFPSILMLICFMFYYMFSQSVIFQKNEQASIQLVNMASENLSMNALRLAEDVDNMSTSDFFVDLKKDPENSDAVAQLEKLQVSMKSRLVRFYDEHGTLIKAYGVEEANHPILMDFQEKWYYDKKERAFMYLSPIHPSNHMMGYLCVYFPSDVFAPSFVQARSDTAALFILDEDDRVMFGQGDFVDDTQLEIVDGEATIGTKKYYVNEQNIRGLSWKIANVVRQDYVYEEINNFRNLILLYCVIAMILLLIFSTITYHSMHDPIDHILKSMHEFREDNLEAIRIEDGGRDEMHTLSETFNELLLRIDELLTTIQREQEQQRETQIQLLQAQINPHFLFNTLNTLKYLAILNEDKPVSEGINALAKLLRNTIVDSNEMVTVQEEIENVKNYIIIQKLRYGDLFETVYNIDDDVKYQKILKFLLQPIVENSILHAFEEDREHQILTIRAKIWKHCLRIEIGDNGKGFQVLKAEASNKKLSSIGMKNIQERIQLMYGDAYSMKVESVMNVGTITTLILPLQS